MNGLYLTVLLLPFSAAGGWLLASVVREFALRTIAKPLDLAIASASSRAQMALDANSSAVAALRELQLKFNDVTEELKALKARLEAFDREKLVR